MKKILIFTIFSLLMISLHCNHSFIIDEEWNNNKIKILEMSDENILENLKNYDFGYQDVEKGKITFSNTIDDTVKLGSILYVPDNYDFNEPTSMIVYLHGGISLQEPHDVEEWDITENSFYPFLQEKGWLGFFPTGKNAYTWWDDPGIGNLMIQINTLRTKYNIDSDRIYMTGVSDGGSGSYCFASLLPNQFASFYPIIGSVGVHSSSRQEAFAPGNLSNRFIYAINNDNDALYPSEAMKEINKLLFDNGANILYKEINGFSHEFPYGKTEIPAMIDLMEKNPRNPFRNKIYWEAYTPRYGQCDWINIRGIDSTMTRKEWHKKFQHKCWTKRIIFGFNTVQDVEKEGYKIVSVSEGYTAEKIGLKPGDIVTRIDDVMMETHGDIWEVKENIVPGKEFTFYVDRDGKKLELKGMLENYLDYEAFPYNTPSGAVKAEYFDNEFHIETSRISEFQILLNDTMVNMKNPVRVFVNGELMFEEKTDVDPKFIKREFGMTFDKKAIWYNKLEFEINED